MTEKEWEMYIDAINDESHYEDLENEKYNRPSWKKTFIDIAKVISRRSKDPHTQVGAVLVKNNCIIGTGYNGDPRNFRYKFNWNTSEKYDYVIHAEMNALANACYNGCQVKDSEIYLTLSPCNKCILQLIQFGVKRIYYLTEYKDFELTKKIADNADIELIKMEDK